MKISSILYSVLNNKCPKCHQGDFFVKANSYDLKNFTKMYKFCPVCSESYEPEPGYYFGAMYVSYAINVAIMVAVWIGFELFFSDDISVWWVVLFTILIGLAFTPVIFRWSRIIWINIFVKYDSSRKGIKERN